MLENNGIMPPKILSDVTAHDIHSRLVDMWLHSLSPNTRKYYRRIADHFINYIGKPLHLATLADVQGWHLTLNGLAPGSQGTYISAIKSLLSFCHEAGLLPVNVGKAMRQPKTKDTLNKRILTELEVQTMIATETNQRNRLILRLLYSGGLRVGELCSLKWDDLNCRGSSGGQVTVYGKGGKTRTVLIAPNLWAELMALMGDASPTDAVFASPAVDTEGNHLDVSQVFRIVQNAGKRAGIKGKVSPHWLRHAHASHSLDRGAPIHLVQQTLGHASVATTSRYLHARPNDSSALYLPD